MEPLDRWARSVRRPGKVEILNYERITVPPIGGATATSPGQPGLRLTCRPADGSPGPVMIDVTSTAVIAQLEPWLQSGLHVGRVLSWRSHGFGVLRRDTVSFAPMGGNTFDV
jgi:hypothetical protein